MGTCAYCGKSAGLFRSQHETCEQAAQLASALLASATGEIGDLKSKLAELSRTAPSPEVHKKGLVRGWESLLDSMLEDSVLSAEEEHRLMEVAEELNLNQNDLDGHRAWTRAAEAAALRDLVEGKLPERAKIEGNLPFNLQAGEQIVWLFPRTEYHEQRVRRSYAGVSQGLSIRVARGFTTGPQPSV